MPDALGEELLQQALLDLACLVDDSLRGMDGIVHAAQDGGDFLLFVQ